jgi:hypothetical protein
MIDYMLDKNYIEKVDEDGRNWNFNAKVSVFIQFSQI